MSFTCSSNSFIPKPGADSISTHSEHSTISSEGIRTQPHNALKVNAMHNHMRAAPGTRHSPSLEYNSFRWSISRKRYQFCRSADSARGGVQRHGAVASAGHSNCAVYLCWFILQFDCINIPLFSQATARALSPSTKATQCNLSKETTVTAGRACERLAVATKVSRRRPISTASGIPTETSRIPSYTTTNKQRTNKGNSSCRVLSTVNTTACSLRLSARAI